MIVQDFIKIGRNNITWILLFISYIIGIVGYSIAVIIEDDKIKTFNDLNEVLIDSPAFIPVLNIFCLIVHIIICVLYLLMFCVYKFCGLEKIWNEIKDKKTS